MIEVNSVVNNLPVSVDSDVSEKVMDNAVVEAKFIRQQLISTWYESYGDSTSHGMSAVINE